ncbi:MAG: hypothetical protein ACEQSB_01120 [Undibacterium sp.]
MKRFLRPILFVLGAIILFCSIQSGRETVANEHAIKKGLTFYHPEMLDSVRVDDALLIQLIRDSKAARIANLRPDVFSIPLSRRFSTDPLRRLLTPEEPVPQLTLTRRADPFQPLPVVNNNSYTVDPPYDRALRDPYDDILFKALYCDQTGYDDGDFAILRSTRNRAGNYADTHFLLGLLLLRENGCFDEKRLSQEIKITASDIALAESHDSNFSDLYAERIVFLYWAGFGNLVQSKWIAKIRSALTPDPGWRDVESDVSNAHTTGLALLALLYAEDGRPKQSFYSLAKTAPTP